jgi:hypothetical protein
MHNAMAMFGVHPLEMERKSKNYIRTNSALMQGAHKNLKIIDAVNCCCTEKISDVNAISYFCSCKQYW